MKDENKKEIEDTIKKNSAKIGLTFFLFSALFIVGGFFNTNIFALAIMSLAAALIAVKMDMTWVVLVISSFYAMVVYYDGQNLKMALGAWIAILVLGLVLNKVILSGKEIAIENQKLRKQLDG